MSVTKACDDILSLPTHELIAMKHKIELELLSRDVCEHGVQTGNWCPYCNAEMKAAIAQAEQ